MFTNKHGGIMYTKSFYFGKEITSDTLFLEHSEYGFIDQDHVPGKTKSEQSLYSGGWNIRQSAKSSWRDAAITTPSGVEIISDRNVIIFKVLVPQYGSYQITISSKAGEHPINDMSIFSGRRNLVERNIQVHANDVYTKTFFTFVSPYIPAMTSHPLEEKAIYISLTGKHAVLTELHIEKKDCPTIFIAGDSTLTDQNALFPYYPYGSCAGWAQVLLQYFNSLAICNQAHSGMTTNCFRDDGHWDIIKQNIKKGDIVMLQFGHNDQKRRNLAAFGGYINNLRWYITQIKSFGAFPILFSPISRIPFKDGDSFRSLLANHAQACKIAADECQVPFIDLHELTFQLWCTLGEDIAKDYFMKGDITHTNDYGANQIASFVISEIKRKKIEPLCSMISSNIIDPFTPDSDTKVVPIEPSNGSMFDIEIPYIDIQDIPEYEYMKEALQKGLLDPCVMHLHPTEHMPRAQFLMIFFKALRISGERPYLGEFCDISRYEWDSSYVQACITHNLIDPITVPNHHFRPDDGLTYAEYASFLIRGLEPNAQNRNISLEKCMSNALDLGFIEDISVPDKLITRAECYKGLVIYMNTLHNSEQALPSDSEIHPVG